LIHVDRMIFVKNVIRIDIVENDKNLT